MLIATAVDGIVANDATNLVQIYNDACERFSGYGADEVIGQNLSILVPQPYRDLHDGYQANYRQSGEKTDHRHRPNCGRSTEDCAS